MALTGRSAFLLPLLDCRTDRRPSKRAQWSGTLNRSLVVNLGTVNNDVFHALK